VDWILHLKEGFCSHGNEHKGFIKTGNFLTGTTTISSCKNILHVELARPEGGFERNLWRPQWNTKNYSNIFMQCAI